MTAYCFPIGSRTVLGTRKSSRPPVACCVALLRGGSAVSGTCERVQTRRMSSVCRSFAVTARAGHRPRGTPPPPLPRPRLISEMLEVSLTVDWSGLVLGREREGGGPSRAASRAVPGCNRVTATAGNASCRVRYCLRLICRRVTAAAAAPPTATCRSVDRLHTSSCQHNVASAASRSGATFRTSLIH